MYFVSQRARQDVKVALIGQGPDELFVVTSGTWVFITEIGGAGCRQASDRWPASP